MSDGACQGCCCMDLLRLTAESDSDCVCDRDCDCVCDSDYVCVSNSVCDSDCV